VIAEGVNRSWRQNLCGWRRIEGWRKPTWSLRDQMLCLLPKTLITALREKVSKGSSDAIFRSDQVTDTPAGYALHRRQSRAISGGRFGLSGCVCGMVQTWELTAVEHYLLKGG